MNERETIDYTAVATPFGAIGVAATPHGLCALAPLGGAAGAPESLLALARQGRPDARIVAHDPRSALPPRLAEAVAALTAYLAGDPRPYEGPLDLRGTPFQQAVWRRLLEIPWGTTLTYGELAAALGRPRAARAVGAAVGANPVSLLVPCHRVVGRRGTLTGFAWGLDLKRTLLNHEVERKPGSSGLPGPRV